MHMHICVNSYNFTGIDIKKNYVFIVLVQYNKVYSFSDS